MKLGKFLLRLLSYILVAAVAVSITAFFLEWKDYAETSKLEQLRELILERFIDDVDQQAMDDAAAAAMVNALGNPWSYYIPAAEYAAHMENQANAYVGVGITISVREDGTGMDIVSVEPTGGAADAGILPGDVLIQVEDQGVEELTLDGARALVQGQEGTTVSMMVRRNGEILTFQVERRSIQVVVAHGQMLEDNIGLVTINNFNERCADETLAAIEALLEQRARALIFDLRFNPGGYKQEMVKILDYLLPEGVLFQSVEYTGQEQKDMSNADCLELPMAVLVNGDSYSAAEFFAAALEEYDWAVTVGQPTTGKSHYQYLYDLKDGSAVNLSVGKYLTPNGVSLADEGGLTPEILVEVDEETYADIYYDLLPVEEDPQIQAAVEALK